MNLILRFHQWLIERLSFGRPFILNCEVGKGKDVGVLVRNGKNFVMSNVTVLEANTAIRIEESAQ